MNIERQYIGARYVPILGGAWDRNKSYEALTIVQANNNSYTSKKQVPPGVDITNSEYWVVTGNFNGQVEEYRQQLEGVARIVTEVAEKTETSLKLFEEELSGKISDFYHVLTPSRFYVDNVNGNDENDGSEISPFKTLTPVFNVLNKKSVDTRCYIVRPGVYEIPYSEFSSVTLHIQSTVPGVTVRFTNAVGCAIYNSHWNIGGTSSENMLTIESGGEAVYWENCVTAINYAILNCPIRFWGNGGSIANCVIYKTVELYNFTGRLTSCTSKITDAVSPIFTCDRSCLVNMTGSWQMDGRSSQAIEGSCFVKCLRSILTVESTARSNENNPYNGLVATSSIVLFSAKSFYDAMKSRSVNGNKISGSVVFDGESFVYDGAVKYDNGLKYFNGSTWVAAN